MCSQSQCFECSTAATMYGSFVPVLPRRFRGIHLEKGAFYLVWFYAAEIFAIVDQKKRVR